MKTSQQLKTRLFLKTKRNQQVFIYILLNDLLFTLQNIFYSMQKNVQNSHYIVRLLEKSSNHFFIYFVKQKYFAFNQTKRITSSRVQNITKERKVHRKKQIGKNIIIIIMIMKFNSDLLIAMNIKFVLQYEILCSRKFTNRKFNEYGYL